MLNPLAALVITFIVMSVVSVIGIVLLYLIKNEKTKKGIFYFLSIWGMVVAACNVMGIPTEWTMQIALAVGLGLLSMAGLLIQLCTKKENRFKIAKILVTISVVAGMIDCFLI